jgi:putative SOS response-associated peptidase YedK
MPALSCARRLILRVEKDRDREAALRDRAPRSRHHGARGFVGELHSPAGEWIRTFAIITTQPNELCAQLHNRMPAVLKPEMWPAWLVEKPATVRDLKAMLAPFPSEDMICWPVSTRVGSVKNNDPSLIEPVAAT